MSYKAKSYEIILLDMPLKNFINKYFFVCFFKVVYKCKPSPHLNSKDRSWSHKNKRILLYI